MHTLFIDSKKNIGVGIDLVASWLHAVWEEMLL